MKLQALSFAPSCSPIAASELAWIPIFGNTTRIMLVFRRASRRPQRLKGPPSRDMASMACPSSASRSLGRCSARIPRQSVWEAQQTRGISMSWLQKTAAGEERWAERALKIANGEQRHVWDILEERGYIKDVAGNPDKIKEIMRIKRVGAYVGVDPTADSLHVGHLLSFMPLFWLWLHGHPAVTLLGGSTARIGDPTDRLKSRELMSNSQISVNITKMHYQLGRLWHNIIPLREKYGFEFDWAAKHHLLNNNMWLGGLSVYDFIKRLARHTRIGPMLSRDTVKRKMTEGDGMSLGEFMYPLFQGWDFWHMYNRLGIQVQIGGSDQYGNIVAGIEALRTIRETEEAPHLKMSTDWQHEPFGFTVPLLLDSAGVKFGKSAGNAVWLDEFKTTAFDLYGYFVRQPDDKVEQLLKLFTFIPLPKIEEIMVEHRADPSKRVAQHTVAFEVLSLVHGSQRALQEAQQHEFRFGGKLPRIIKEPAEGSGILNANTRPRSDMQLPTSVLRLGPAKLLFAAGLAQSNSEGQRLVGNEGAYVAAAPGRSGGLVPGNLSWTPIKMWFPHETARYVIDEKLLIIRKGKHNVRIIELVTDEEWAASGQTYPGQPFTGKIRRVIDRLKKEAEADGVKLESRKFRALVGEKTRELDIRTVANNPDIELPSRQDVRDRAKERKGRSFWNDSKSGDESKPRSGRDD